MAKPWPDAALVLVGHGSSRKPESSRPTYRHGEEIRRSRLFAEVRVAFLKERPFLRDILADIDAPRVYVVPHMAYNGYITTTVIPREMSLARKAAGDPADERRFYLCEAIGTHPLIARTVADRLRRLIAENALGPEDTCVLIASHGTVKDPEAEIQAEALADRLARLGVPGAFRTAFLEHAPLIEDWAHMTTAPNVIVVPFLIAGGQHGGEDIPGLLGLDPGDRRMHRADGAPAGPFEVRGRRLWYLRPVGIEPIIAEVIVDRVAEAAERDAVAG